MQYVEGETLKSWLLRSTDLLARVDIWKQYAAAMMYLYEDQGLLHGDPHGGNVMLQPAPIGYVTPSLKGSFVPIDTKHKIVVLDAGTSIFWRARADFEQREKRLVVEMINSMFGQVCFARRVKMDRSLPLKEIIAMGNVLAVLFAYYVSAPPQGLDGMEAAMDEFDYVKRNISPFLSAALRDGGKASARRRMLMW